jgi:ERCC4-type nuclease
MIIDSSEPKEIQNLFPDADIQNLETGDFLEPETKLVIERKSLPDLLASIADNRLYNQCSRLYDMKKDGYHPLLLVQGILESDGSDESPTVKGHPNWGYYSVIMSLLSVQQGGIPVIVIPDHLLSETIHRLCEYSYKSNHRVVKRQARNQSLASNLWIKPSERCQALSALVGGLKRASLLLAEYHTISNAIDHIDEWTSIKGIGTKTVEGARSLIFDDTN